MKPRTCWDRYNKALNLRKEGKTYREIGEYSRVTLERARQMVCKAERHEQYTSKEPDPLIRTIQMMSIPFHSVSVVRALRNACYDGNYRLLAAQGPRSLIKVKNLGVKGIRVIGEALQRLGVVKDVNHWMWRLQIKDGEICPKCGRS